MNRGVFALPVKCQLWYCGGMSEQQNEATESTEDCKPRFRRKRSKDLKVVEEIEISSGKWRQPTATQRKYPGRRRFKIAGLYVAGERVRRIFGTRLEAETFIEQQVARTENLGARVSNVDGRLLEHAVECESLLEKHNVTLLDAIREFLSARESLAPFPGVLVTEAAKHYAKLLEERATSWTVNGAAKAWLDSRKSKGRSVEYLRGAKLKLKKFQDVFGESSLADIRQLDVEQWANGLGLGTQTVCHHLQVLNAMFAHAVKRGGSPRNPVEGIERPDVIRPEAGILSPSQLRSLLEHLPDDTVPYVVLSAFAGLRPSEVMRLDWSEVNLATGFISVFGGKAKTKRRRAVKMTDNLKAWLKPLAKETGKVVKLADITIRQKRMIPARTKAGIKWLHDCLRHSAATYWLETEGDSARVAAWLGDSEVTLHQHYKGKMNDPADAAEWFAIMPEPAKTPENVIPIKAA
jgi:integrase